ncbi:Piso0_003095 [Millerozyma farinosa CBS 7064]|uniref:Piso0_003095 protein n=1 Tax=Pichia sorbitophila (strain ATCC MYA-4447 / BCRC 22081 / CBS 7064 / NBRC 10061 / NRRL Y-12695) TaxID=559304 RepID=G8YKB9_PICSO|nr:Piso0_003095 [Millerozyma farinosa CBS 7064]CCE80764.1 Piso0_003095 [Millerozyma farinosa CBS 7064]
MNSGDENPGYGGSNEEIVTRTSSIDKGISNDNATTKVAITVVTNEDGLQTDVMGMQEKEEESEMDKQADGAKAIGDFEFRVSPPVTVFKYYQVESSTIDRIFSHASQRIFLVPRAVLENVDHSDVKVDQNESIELINDGHVGAAPDLDLAEPDKKPSANWFSGYCDLPKISLNYTRSSKLQSRSPDKFDAPQFCYHSHVVSNNVSYTFGGMYVDASCSMADLGIPEGTSPDKITVRLAAELPPHINMSILASPYMVHNPHFVAFNSSLCTFNYLDTSFLTEFPWKLCCASSTKISEYHFLVYGGFEVVVESVENHKEDSWLVTKKIVMNNDAYIFDSKMLSFQKVSLNFKGRTNQPVGRVGHALVSNACTYSLSNIASYPSDTPSSPAFMDSIDDRSSIPHSASTVDSSANSSTDLLKLRDSKYLTSIEAVTDRFTSSSRSDYPDASRSTLDERVSTPKEEYASSAETSQRATPVMSPKNSAISFNSQKFSSMLSKSSKLFQKANHKPINRPKSATDFTLRNTYSKKVQDDRSSSIINYPSGNGNGNGNGNSNGNSKQGPTLKASNTRTSRDSDRVSNLSSSQPSPVKTRACCDCEGGSCKNSDCNYFSPESTQTKADFLHILNNGEGKDHVSILIFGGFYATEDHGVQTFKASQAFLKIELPYTLSLGGIEFATDTSIYSFGSMGECLLSGDYVYDEPWPSPRGFCAYELIDYTSPNDDCALNFEATYSPSLQGDTDDEASTGFSRPGSPLSVFETSSSTANSFQTTSSKNGSISGKSKLSLSSFFRGKALIIHGGCNEHYKTFSDLFLFVFDTGKWEKMSTYAHKYDAKKEDFGGPGDEANEGSPIFEAELRACHHTALYYKSEERNYLFFMGGFSNSYLRLFDPEPYVSDKLDVSKYAKFNLARSNNQSRVLALNLRTQKWSFFRYFHDCSEAVSKSFTRRLPIDRPLEDVEFCNYGGAISLDGKCINMCHGLACPVPVNAEEYEALKTETSELSFLWGIVTHFTFPGL